MQELLFEPNFLYSDGPYTSWEHPMKVIYKKRLSLNQVSTGSISILQT